MFGLDAPTWYYPQLNPPRRCSGPHVGLERRTYCALKDVRADIAAMVGLAGTSSW